MTIVEQAAALRAQGFRVFPLKPGTKLPAVKGWASGVGQFKIKDTDNIGIFTGCYGEDQALLVVDIDNKGDKRGDESILNLELQGHDLPETLTAITPSGGRHLYYTVSAAVKQGANVLGPGIDIRSAGGYVVAPGSRVGNAAAGCDAAAGAYRFAEPTAPLAPAPAWLIEACGAVRSKDAEAVKPLVGVDAERAWARAKEYLEREAPAAVEGDGGDFATYKVAARVKDYGVTESECTALMLEHWHEGCGWSAEELAVKVRNAYAYGLSPPGVGAPEAVFEPVAPSVSAPREVAASRYRLESVAQVLARPPPRWLIRGILPDRGMAVVYGAPGSGKTFLILDIATAIARGTPWAARRTRRGRVVYVGLEGHVGARLRAYTKAFGLDGGQLDCLSVIERQPVDLLQADDAVALARDIRATNPDPVALIVIDTLNRSIPGGDENSSEDMGRAIYAADYLARELNCLVCFVHHSGKAAGAGARGHSSLLGATDAELSVYRNDEGERFVETTKVKDGDDGERFAFRLNVVDLGAAKDHDPEADDDERITSCVVENLHAVARVADAPRTKLGTHAVNAVRAFRKTLEMHALEPGRAFGDDSIEFAKWKDAFKAEYVDDPAWGKRFYDARAELSKKGFIENTSNGRVALTDAGKLQ